MRGLAHYALGALDLAGADIAAACKISHLQGAVTLLRRAEETQRAVLEGDWSPVEFRRALAEENRT